MTPSKPTLSAQEAILSLVAERGPGKSICPSEAARLVDPADWRAQMDAVRGAAAALAREGVIVATQKGRPVDIAAAKGPVRLAAAKP